MSILNITLDNLMSLMTSHTQNEDIIVQPNQEKADMCLGVIWNCKVGRYFTPIFFFFFFFFFFKSNSQYFVSGHNKECLPCSVFGVVAGIFVKGARLFWLNPFCNPLHWEKMSKAEGREVGVAGFIIITGCAYTPDKQNQKIQQKNLIYFIYNTHTYSPVMA